MAKKQAILTVLLWVRKYLPYISVFTAFVLSIAFGLILERGRAEDAKVRAQISVIERLNTLRASIEGNLIGKSLVARGLVATFEADPNISQERYDALAKRITANDPEIINLAVARNLTVEYIYPYEANKAVLGFDYSTSQAQLDGVKRAFALDKTIIVGPLKLFQGKQGFISRTPIHMPEELASHGAFWGIASIVIDADMLYRNFGLLDDTLTLDVALRQEQDSGDGAVFFGSPALLEADAAIVYANLPGAKWQILAIPKGGWPLQGEHYVILRIFFVSVVVLFSFLAVYSIHLLAGKRQAEQRLASAIEAVDDGFAIYGPDDRYVSSNTKYREIYSLTKDLFKPGVPFEKIIREGVKRGQYPAAKGQEEVWIAQRLLSHNLANSDVEQQLPDGRFFRISERKTNDGSTVGFRVDITELKNAKDAAVVANRAKSNFISVLSHELRTPLTVILGNAQLIVHADALPQVKGLITALDRELLVADEIRAEFHKVLSLFMRQGGRMKLSGEHLLNLINQMLDFSKAETGKLEMKIERVSAKAALDMVYAQFKEAAEAKNIEFNCQSGDEMVFADSMRLVQILINLVGNALKFTERGSIHIWTEKEGDYLGFFVEDTGCGIREDQAELIFNEFYQVDATSTRSVGGTGLGLAVVKQLTSLQGGTIEVKSTFGKGSLFKFTLPLAGTPL